MPSPASVGEITSYGVPTLQKDQHVLMRLVDNTQGQGIETFVEFDINPDDMNIQSPSRVTTVNTIAGAYQDNWGPGIGRISISGQTGWRAKQPGGRDGFAFFLALRELHRRYQELCAEHDPADIVFELVLPPGPVVSQTTLAGEQDLIKLLGGLVNSGLGQFINTEAINQFAYYRVSSDNFTAQRNKGESLLFRYQWDMTILKDNLQLRQVDPSKRFVLQPGDLTDPLGGNKGSGGDASSFPPVQGGTTGPPFIGDPGTPPPADPPPVSTANPGLFSQAELTAAATSTHADDGFSHAPPQTVTTATGTTLEALAASNNVTAKELQLYANAHNWAVPPTGTLPAGSTIRLPDTVWLMTFRQNIHGA